MNADEALWPVGRRSEPGDRDRRGIAANDGIGLKHRAHASKYRALDVLLLGRRLDDQIAITQSVQRFRRGDAFERRLPLLFADALATDLPRHVAVDGRNTGFDAVGG